MVQSNELTLQEQAEKVRDLAMEIHKYLVPGMSMEVQWPSSPLLVPGQPAQMHKIIITRPTMLLRMQGKA